MAFINIDGDIFKITKKYSDFVWRLQNIETKEIVNVFYSKEHSWTHGNMINASYEKN